MKENYSSRKWVNVETKLPEESSLVICWCGNGYKFCKYRKVLTWKGRKLHFVNLVSRGFIANDVTHWRYLPLPPGKNNL